MKNYYLRSPADKGQIGPFDLVELKAQNISKATPVWYDGLEDWTPAGQIYELKELFKSTPPPYQNKKNAEEPEKKSLLWQLITAIAVIVLLILGLQFYNQVKENRRTESQQLLTSLAENRKEQIRNNIAQYVKVGNSSYLFMALGGIKNLSLTLTNSSPYLLNSVRVKLSYIKADGGLWKDQMVDFTYIPANTIQTVRVPDSDRGTSIRYEIIEIKSAELGLN